jgi:flavin reductase (DIM6/NTAB) family NADH-FMN oxidoreductase RutF
MIKHFTKDAFSKLERFYKANLINSSTGFKPANLIGTINESGLTNLAIFSSVVHLGSDPALIAFVQRPIIDTSHTYKNILETGQYTINHVHKTHIKDAHQTSGKYEESEFEKCNFSEAWIENFKAPFVKESNVKLGLEFVEEIYIKHNGTRLMIGEVKHLILDDAYIADDGLILLDDAGSSLVSGLDHYHSAKAIERFGYVSLK